MQNSKQDVYTYNDKTDLSVYFRNLFYQTFVRQSIEGVNMSALQYFLQKNFELIFGKYELATSEIDCVTHIGDSVELKTIFGKNITIHFVKNQMGYEVIGETDEKDIVFKMALVSNIAVDEVTFKDENGVRRETYRIDEGYSLLKESGVDEQHLNKDYHAKVTPIYAKYKDQDYFEIEIMEPKQKEKSASLLKRISDYVKGGRIFSIPSFALEEDLSANAAIFDKLTEKSKEVNKILNRTK